ncbi:steroid 17-alpha-hydroxylase/17,20 lyase-like [Mizuhopecten yessoensis]|uniref:Steroid 21-hydroxylase n=1 Tax=Mizuhopecten yessoensis TaxID=6573 RepID=A0A210QDD1_MIZYE|nr:steroid 17-alpha-hydroxylase/17,20 lyase-like [Mizuhopecten yessoensis]OWF46735.1 Steroid 17-alpha-hydroxylase/17,20 lyase [Mizuhopecten yessoensis]
MEDIKDQLRDGFQQLKETLGPMHKYVTPTSALVGLGAGLSVYWLIKRSKYNLPPGPTPIPVVGNYSLMGDKDFHASCVKLSHKYGPVITIYLGMSPVIIVNTIEAATEVLVKSKADFADRVEFPSGNKFSEGGKDIAFAHYTPTWKLHRKIAGSALRTYLKGGKLEEAIHGSLSQVIELFENLKEEPFVPHPYIDLAVFNIIHGLCFHKVYKFDDPRFKRLVDLDNELITTFGSGFLEDLFPFLLKIWPSSRFNKAMQLAEQVLQFLDDELQEHITSFDEGNIRDFADALILARKEAENDEDTELLDQLTEAHLRQTLNDIFFAGFDTTRFTLQWFFLYMAANPEEQKIAQKEIDTAVGGDRLPGLGDRNAMPYTEAVLHEVMRIASVAPFGVPHAARNDSKLYEYDIPKGTMVMINHWALHNDPKHWKDPSKFDPKRFLDSDGNLAPKPVSWLPFSAGRRVCLGESAAKPELHLICATILQQFEIMLPPGVTADFSPDVSGIGGYTANQYKIVVQKRT